jgi:hypothetical protein
MYGLKAVPFKNLSLTDALGTKRQSEDPPLLALLALLAQFLQAPGSHMSSNRDISATYYRSGRSYA